MDRTDTRDIAALLSATDNQGHVDPVMFEAQRLILHHQRAGSLDSDGLMRAVHQSPLYDSPDHDRLIHTIDENLDTPQDRQHFGQSMEKSYWLNQAGHELGQAYGAVKHRLAEAEHEKGERMAVAQQWSQQVQGDPQRSAFVHGVAVGASAMVGIEQFHDGLVKGASADAASAVTGVADLGKMAYRLSTDENYRDALVRVASAYASEVGNDPAKPAKDLYHGGREALENWQAGLAKAKAEGRQYEYAGHAGGTAGMEVLLAAVPASKAGKFGEVARILDHAPIRSTEQVAEMLAKARVLEREGGDAARGAEEVIRATVRDARAHGDLSMVLEAAKRTDTVNGLLRSGALEPKELGEIAKLDYSVFKSATSTSTRDGVTFAQAMQTSTHGSDLARLGSKQLGDVGEALHTYDMVGEGYTDIIAIKNRSGHGIDFVGRNPHGALEFHEVKTSAVGRAAEQSGDPKEFVADRLRKAIAARGHWDPRNTLPDLNQTALRLRDEVEKAGGQIDAKWVQLNLSHTPGSPKLNVEKTIEQWTARPLNKTAQRDAFDPAISPTIAGARPREIPGDIRDPKHPGHEPFRGALEAVHRMEARHGIASGPHSEQVAVALATTSLRQNLHINEVRVDPKGDQATLVQHPQVYGNVPEKTASIPIHQALSTRMAQHSAQWLQARSPVYASALPAAERTPEQARALSQLSPNDQAMFAHIRQRVPAQISDEVVAHATVSARQHRIGNPQGIHEVMLAGDTLHIRGREIWSGLASVDLSQPLPTLQASVEKAQSMDQQPMQLLAQQPPPNQNGPKGPVM